MAQIAKFTPGTFCWVDLATTDTDGAKAFYTELFGWSSVDMPAGDGMVYTMFEKNGSMAAALFEMDPRMQEQQIPPHWNSYIASSDVDAMTAKAEELGATVIMAPMDVEDAGRMSVIQDPEGAVFCLWQSVNDEGTTLKDEPGGFCWNELYVNDLENAINFYETLFGWEHVDETGAIGQRYVMFKLGETMVAGMMQIQPDWGEMPPLWGIYLAVENCDATIAKAESLGGTSAMEPMEIENVGRFGTIIDPQGAAFMVLQSAECD